MTLLLALGVARAADPVPPSDPPVAPVAPVADAGCPTGATVASFDGAVARAELGIQTLDAASVETAIREADALLPCLEEPVGADHLARWYRARAIHRFVSGDAATGTELFRSSRGLQPAYRLDPDVGAPIQEAYEVAVPSDVTSSLPRPLEGWIVVDGRAGTAAPTDRPFVVQWFGSDGAVRSTTLLAPGTDLPYPVAPVGPLPVPRPAPILDLRPSGRPAAVLDSTPASAPVPAPVVAATRGHASRTLALTGLASGLLAGAGIATAAALQEELLASGEPSSEHPGLVSANRAVGYSAGGFGVVAVGLGLSAVVVGRW